MAGNLLVNVEGLRDVQKHLKKIGAIEQSKELKTGLREAAKVVALEARTRVPVKTGRARASVKWSVDMGGAYVRSARKEVPYYGWLDFGSRNPISGRPRSVGPWKKSGAGPFRGRLIYTAMDDKADEVTEMILDAFKKLASEYP